MSDARQVIARFASPTPLVLAPLLSERAGARVYCKLEAVLPTGSFKFRGAVYALSRRQASAPISEVVAASTGNHGAAVAQAAALLGVAATIFLPLLSHPVKRARIEALGARILASGDDIVAARCEASAYALRHAAYLLDDATDADVPIGAGTIADEVLDEVDSPDVIFVPVGDSALIRGVGAVMNARRPQCRVYGVQASSAPSYVLSWRAGHVVTTDHCRTIADGLATRAPVASNVRAIRRLVHEMLLVTEQEISDAVIHLQRDGLHAEPSAAAAVAALLQTARSFEGRTAVVLLTGDAGTSPPAPRAS